MRGNLSTPKTVTCRPPARSRSRVASKSSTAQGPAEVQTTLVSSPKTPSRLIECGTTSRDDSRCRRSQTSSVEIGAAWRSAISTRRTSVCTSRSPSALASGPSSAGAVAPSGSSPSAGDGEPHVEDVAGGVEGGQAEAPGGGGSRSHSSSLGSGRPAYWPVRPSMHSRSRSAWPQWRAYSSIRCTTTSRISIGPSSCCPQVVHRVGRLELLGVRDLGPPGGPGLRHDGVVRDRAVEVGVTVLVLAPHLRQVEVATHHPAPPRELDRREVARRAPAATSSTEARIVGPAARRRDRRTCARTSYGSGPGSSRRTASSPRSVVIAHGHTRPPAAPTCKRLAPYDARAVRCAPQASEPSSAASLRKNGESPVDPDG